MSASPQAVPAQLVRGPAASPRCGECPFAKAGKPHYPVPGEGPIGARWIIVGEGPGETERRTGRPFQGASGRMLDRALLSLGAVRAEEIFVTNALVCTPPSATDGQKRTARACCAPRLWAELAEFPGRPVLALGAVAAQGLLGETFSITNLAGSLHEIDVDGTGTRAIIPTIHPAAILRGGDEGAAHAVDLLYWNLVYDAGKVHRLARGELSPFSLDVEIETQDPARAEALVEGVVADARRLGHVAVDTETTSLRPLTTDLKAIGVATVERAISVAWPITTRHARRRLAGLLGDSTVRKILYNRLYDLPVLKRHGLPVRGRVDDPMLRHHNAFPGLAHDLQRVGTQFFPLPPWKAEHRQSDKETIEGLCRYNAIDTLVTARLDEPLARCVDRAQATATYESDLEMARIAERMHEVGMPVDVPANHALTERFRAEIARARVDIEAKAADPALRPALFDRIAFEQAKTWRGGTGDKSGRNRSNQAPDPPDFLGRHKVRLAELEADAASACKICFGKGHVEPADLDVHRKRRRKELPAVGPCVECATTGKGWIWNIASDVHVAGYLKARGLPLFQETKGGKLSTKKEILDGLGYHPEVQGLLEYREADKMLSTFVVNVARARYADGRIHPRWNVNMITGRWSAEDPQVMNFPKASKRKNRPNLRSQIVAPPGKVFVGFDLSQADARGMALMSGDEWLCEVFSHPPVKYGPGDIHTRFTRLVWADFDDHDPEDRDHERDFIKRTEYGALYGGAVDTLWKNLLKDDPGVRREDVARVVDILQNQLRGLNAWHAELLRQVQTPPFTITEPVLGRRRVFPLGNASVTDVYAFPPQSCTASVMAVGLAKFFARMPRGCEIINQIHDAALLEVDEPLAGDVRALVEECFNQTFAHRGVTVPFPCEVKVGRSWDKV